MKSLIGILSLITILCSCAEPSFRYYELPKAKLQGKIVDGDYYDFRGLYSFTVPEMSYGEKISESSPAENNAFIVFHDDLGNLVSLDIQIASEKEMDGISLQILAHSYRAVIEDFFHYAFLQPIQELSPSFEIIERKFIDIEEIGLAYFALLNIPGGSTLSFAETGKKCDAKRAYMISFCENHLLTLSAQESMIVQNAIKLSSKTDGESNQELYDKLIELRKSYKISK